MAKQPDKNPKKKKKKQPKEEVDSIVDRERLRDETLARSKADEFYGPGQIPTISTDMSGQEQNIADAEAAYDNSKVRDAYVQDALDRMKMGLEGYTPQEMQAFRTIGERGINTSAATANRTLQQGAGEAGLSGQALLREQARIEKDAMKARAQIGTNLMAQQAEEKATRLNKYGEFASQEAKNMADARSLALDRLMGSRNKLTDYSIDQNRVNLDQENKRKAGYLGVYYGEQASNAARRGDVRGRRLAEKALELAMQGV